MNALIICMIVSFIGWLVWYLAYSEWCYYWLINRKTAINVFLGGHKHSMQAKYYGDQAPCEVDFYLEAFPEGAISSRKFRRLLLKSFKTGDITILTSCCELAESKVKLKESLKKAFP